MKDRLSPRVRLALIIFFIYLCKYQYEINEFCTELEQNEFDNRSLILADSPCNTLNHIYEGDLECAEIRKKIQPKARQYAWRTCMWEKQFFFNWGWMSWGAAGIVLWVGGKRLLQYNLEKYKIDRRNTQFGKMMRDFSVLQTRNRKRYNSGLVIEEILD
jgi:hypothetical protein